VKVIRDRRDARWLPSRFHFALFRLFAYLRLRATKPQPSRGVVMVVDQYQSAGENYAVTICIFVVMISFVTALLNPTMSLPAACAIALPAAAVIIQVQIVLTGVIITIARKVAPTEGDNLAVSSIALMTLTIGAAIFTFIRDSPARFVAGAFLLLVALNAIAAVLVFLMRGAITDAERRFGVEP
jgi:hypothetical protein